MDEILAYLSSRGFERVDTDYEGKELYRMTIDTVVISAEAYKGFFTIVVNYGRGNGGTMYLQEKISDVTLDKIISCNELLAGNLLPRRKTCLT